MDFDWLFPVAFFWLLTVPLLTLLHEIGHALGGLVTTCGWVQASLGKSRPSWTLRMGRLYVDLRAFTGFVGFCHREHPPATWRGEVLFYALGPATSILCAGVFLALSQTGTLVDPFLRSAASGALFQFIVTIVPVRYPSWLGAYAGYRSDGAAIIACVRARKPVSRR